MTSSIIYKDYDKLTQSHLTYITYSMLMFIKNGCTDSRTAGCRDSSIVNRGRDCIEIRKLHHNIYTCFEFHIYDTSLPGFFIKKQTSEAELCITGLRCIQLAGCWNTIEVQLHV